MKAKNPSVIAVQIVAALAWVPEDQREVVIDHLRTEFKVEVRKLYA